MWKRVRRVVESDDEWCSGAQRSVHTIMKSGGVELNFLNVSMSQRLSLVSWAYR